MSDDKIPQRVKDFITRHIGSVAHLEVLLMMRRQPSDYLSAEDVSKELRTSVQAAQQNLGDLHAGHLLDLRNGPPTTYRYCVARGSQTDTVIAELEKAYAERRFTVIDLIFSKPLKHVQVFADAFKLWTDKKKDDTDG